MKKKELRQQTAPTHYVCIPTVHHQPEACAGPRGRAYTQLPVSLSLSLEKRFLRITVIRGEGDDSLSPFWPFFHNMRVFRASLVLLLLLRLCARVRDTPRDT